MDTPFPTKALLASFHSGRWVFIQIPASGIKLESLESAVANIFSIKLALTIAPLESVNKAPSAPIVFRRDLIL